MIAFRILPSFWTSRRVFSCHFLRAGTNVVILMKAVPSQREKREKLMVSFKYLKTESSR